MSNNEYQQDEVGQDVDFLGYCAYCKREVYQHQELKRKRKKVWHQFCYDQEHDIVEELHFK